MKNPSPYNKNYKQGFFKAKNPDKIIGIEVPFYRSGIERDFMRWLDDNDNVIKWSSEGVVIKYYDPIKKCVRNYFTDNYVEIKEGNNIKKYIIELKDIKETHKPDTTSKKKKSTLLVEQTNWVTNTAKWRTSIKWCQENNMEFLLLGHSKKHGFQPVKLDFLH